MIFNGLKVRHASIVEIELWGQLQTIRAEAMTAMKPYDQYANVSKYGGTPSEALKKAIGA